MHFFWVLSDQCPLVSDNPFSKVSVNVERKVQPKMAAGSWEECSGWKTSDSLKEKYGVHQEGKK